MVASNFEKSLALVLQSEGGDDDDPQDHGGRTSRGITQREYNAWRAEKGLPPSDVWKAAQTEIETIYHDEYWMPYGDQLPVGLDYNFFNNCVLDGPVTAAKLLQRALGVSDDGRIGPVTRQALAQCNAAEVVIKMYDKSVDYYKSLHQPRFLKGWLNRAKFAEIQALIMTTGVVS